jgi:hypothetical protein
VVFELVFFGRLVVPCRGFFVVSVVVVVFVELIFVGRLVVPCGGFFVATVVVVVVFKLVFIGRLVALAVDCSLRQLLLSSLNLSSLVGLLSLAVDSSLCQS